MRIAIISPPFVTVPPRDYGGTELVVHELVEGLLDRGHDVTLFATQDSVTGARLRGIYPGAQWPPEPLAELNHVSFALSEVARGRFDLVHAHSPAALACGRLVRVPLIYTIHHAQERALSAYYRHFPDVEFVAISEDHARREPGVRRPAVIYHGLNPDHYHWARHPGRHVCFIGRFAPEKGLPIAIDAAARAGVSIEVAGTVHPQDRDHYHTEVEPRLRSSHVRHLGPVGPGQKASLLARSRALLAPIQWNEPFGLVLIEAALSGCPAVAFARGSVPELIEHGVTGFLVHSLEEMAELIRPGGAVEHLDRRRIREIAERRFSRMRMVADYERLYRWIAGARAA